MKPPIRKCCNSPRGGHPHKAGCPQGASLKSVLDSAGVTAADRIDLLADVGDGLPDGAFFALGAEMGIDLGDFLEG